MAEQKWLDSKVWCPVSGFRLKGQTAIPLHKVFLMETVTGTLYANCPTHCVKIFIGDRTTISWILECSNVVRVKQKREKEAKHAPAPKA